MPSGALFEEGASGIVGDFLRLEACYTRVLLHASYYTVVLGSIMSIGWYNKVINPTTLGSSYTNIGLQYIWRHTNPPTPQIASGLTGDNTKHTELRNCYKNPKGFLMNIQKIHIFSAVQWIFLL